MDRRRQVKTSGVVSSLGTRASKSGTQLADAGREPRRKPSRHRQCLPSGMIARLTRFDLSIWEMLAAAVVLGLVAAAFVAVPVG